MKKCPSCNAGPSEPCAYPTENAKRLLNRIRELEERERGLHSLDHERVQEAEISRLRGVISLLSSIKE